jgi:engulfment/cell motility protein 1
MSSHTIEDLTSCILDFQANMVRVSFRKKTTLVEPDHEPSHAAALNFIWASAHLLPEEDGQGGIMKWRKIGFETEDVVSEFSDVGVLGLDALVGISLNVTVRFPDDEHVIFRGASWKASPSTFRR